MANNIVMKEIQKDPEFVKALERIQEEQNLPAASKAVVYAVKRHHQLESEISRLRRNKTELERKLAKLESLVSHFRIFRTGIDQLESEE